MSYFSQSRLMLESEQAITEHAQVGPLVTQRVCIQLLNEPTRYVRWHVRHEQLSSLLPEVRGAARAIYDGGCSRATRGAEPDPKRSAHRRAVLCPFSRIRSSKCRVRNGALFVP